MAFGTFFKKLGGFANKALNAITTYGPQVSKVAKKFGPLGETIGGIVDTGVDVSRIIQNNITNMKSKGLNFDIPLLKG